MRYKLPDRPADFHRLPLNYARLGLCPLICRPVRFFHWRRTGHNPPLPSHKRHSLRPHISLNLFERRSSFHLPLHNCFYSSYTRSASQIYSHTPYFAQLQQPAAPLAGLRLSGKVPYIPDYASALPPMPFVLFLFWRSQGEPLYIPCRHHNCIRQKTPSPCPDRTVSPFPPSAGPYIPHRTVSNVPDTSQP